MSSTVAHQDPTQSIELHQVEQLDSHHREHERLNQLGVGSIESLFGEAYKWLVLMAASAVIFVGVGYTNTFGVFQDYYQSTMFPSTPPLKLILIGSIASSLYLIVGVVMGRFADLVGYRVSLTIGAGLMIASLFCASISRLYYQLLLSQGLMFGLGLAFVYTPAVTISRQYFGRTRHGLANGIVLAGGGLGGCVLPYMVRLAIVQGGHRQAFRLLGYIAVGVLGPSLLILKPRAKHSSDHQASKQPMIDLSLLQDARFVALAIAGTIGMTGFLPRYFLVSPSATARSVSTTYASWLLGIMNGLSIIGRISIGWLADRYGKVIALSSSFVLCGIGHFAFWAPSVAVQGNQATTLGLFTAFSVYTGIFGSGFVSLFPVVVAHLFGAEALASKVGLLNTIMGLGTFAGPITVYSIITSGTDERWTIGTVSAGLFMFVGGVSMAGFLGVAQNPRQRLGPSD